MEKATLTRNCFNCNQELSPSMKSSEFSYLLIQWQMKEFCSLTCLNISIKLEQKLDMCSSCKSSIDNNVKLKLCLRFGSEFHQFCSCDCLEVFKSSNQFCKLCQERILSFMLISEEEKFCSPFCVARYGGRGINQINFVNENVCQVCEKRGIWHYELLREMQSLFFCSKGCIMKYREKEPIKFQCASCGCLLLDSLLVFYFEGMRQVFCSAQCCNVFNLVTKSCEAECSVCEVQKYSIDMIKCQSGNEFKFFCSLFCLETLINSLEEEEASQKEQAVPALKIRSVNDLNERYIDISNELSSDNIDTSEADSQPMTSAENGSLATDEVSLGGLLLSLASRVSIGPGQKIQENAMIADPEVLDIVSRCKTSVSLNILERILSRRSKKTSEKGVGTATDLSDNKLLSCLLKTTSEKGVGPASDDFNEHSPNGLGSQTDPGYLLKNVIPIPYPVYIPTPCYQFPLFEPVPMVIPIPVPVPIPIPILVPKNNPEPNSTEQPMQDSQSDDESIWGDFGDWPQSDPGSEESSDSLETTDCATLPSQICSKASVVQGSAGLTKPALLKDATEDRSWSTADKGQEHKQNNHTGNGAGHKSPKYGTNLDNVPANSGKKEISNETQFTPNNPQSPHSNSSVVLPATYVPISPKHDERSLMSLEPQDVDLNSPMWSKFKSRSSSLNDSAAIWLWNKFVDAKLSDKNFIKTVGKPTVKFRDLSSSDKSCFLATFFTELRQIKSSDHPSSIIYILLCIQKSMMKINIDSIFLNVCFQKFAKLFFSFLEDIISEHETFHRFIESSRRLPGPKITEQMLWESRQLGTFCPSVLLFSIFYYNTKVFRLQRIEDHENMSFRRFIKFSHSKVNKNRTVSKSYSLRYTFPKDSSKPGSKNFCEMPGDKENSWKCPVKIKEYYTARCPTETVNSDNFYLSPIHASSMDAKTWFSARKLPASFMRNMLNFVMMVDEVQQVFQQEANDPVVVLA